MKYIITEEQLKIVKEKIIKIPFEVFDNDWDALQTFLEGRGIQGVLRLTPSEIMMAGQKLGLVNKTKFFLSKTTWKYSIILFLAKAFRSKLAEALSFCIKKLYEIYNQIKNLDKLKILSGSVLSFISLLKEFSDDADFAVKLVEKGNL